MEKLQHPGSSEIFLYTAQQEESVYGTQLHGEPVLFHTYIQGGRVIIDIRGGKVII